MNYQFALNINDDNQNLSPNDGLGFGDLGILIKHLDGAINAKDGQKCTLNKIDNHGYTPHFVTGSKTTYENFIEVHNNIFEKSVIELTKGEATYANTLKKVLKGNKYIEAIDNEAKTIQKIYSAEIERSVDSYFVIKSQSGVISEIGTQNLDKTSHIYLHGINYKIFITPAEDEQLRKYYKEAVVDLKIKQKRSINTGKIISARLISHTVKLDKTLHDSLSELHTDDFSFLSRFNDNGKYVDL